MFKISSITLAVVMTLGASAQAQDTGAGRLRQSNTDVPNQCGEPYDSRGELQTPQWGNKDRFSRDRFDAWGIRRSQSGEQARGAGN